MHEEAPATNSVSPHSGLLPLLVCLAGNVALAFGPWFVRLADVGPVASGFWRVLIAAPVLVALCFATERRPFAGAKALTLLLVVAGVAFAADLSTWNLGIMRTTLANSTLFGNSAILMFPIYGFVAARAWPTRSQGIALGLAAVGGALLLGRSYELSPKNLVGDLFCLFAGTLYTVYLILMARARDTMTPLLALTLATAASVVPLLLFAALLGEKIWPDLWWPLLAIALVSQVLGQGLMIYAIGHLPPLVVGIALLSQPIVSGTVGWVAYGERLGMLDFLGAALVAVALVLVRPVAALKSEAEGGSQ
jgi:drug/metabolite transporter (DMT)-like permease